MKKVLLVDDEVDHIAMMQARVEASGYQCLSAYDGEEGLKIVLSEMPDIILLDIVILQVWTVLRRHVLFLLILIYILLKETQKSTNN